MLDSNQADTYHAEKRASATQGAALTAPASFSGVSVAEFAASVLLLAILLFFVVGMIRQKRFEEREAENGRGGAEHFDKDAPRS